MTVTSTISPSLKMGLQVLGVWPGVHSTVYCLTYISSLLAILYFQYLYLFAHFKLSEISNLVDSMTVILEYSLTTCKLCSLWLCRRVIQQVLTAMDNDWRECIDVEQHLYAMTAKANTSHFCSNVLLSFNTIAAVFFLLSDYALHAMHLVDNYNDTSRPFPIKIQFPFETDHSPIYELLVITIFLHGMSNSYAMAVVNALMFSLVLHVSGQIDIICQEFRMISEKVQLYESSASTLGILIERHNRIISLSDNIEKLFSFIALMQVFWNTLIICCLGFIVIISFHNSSGFSVFAKIGFAFIAITTEDFMFCFAGEYLSLKSQSIAYAAYDSLWYNMPPNYSQIITLMIMRSQRRLTMTAGKVMDLSLEAFASIMKTSASYISVFYAMY